MNKLLAKKYRRKIFDKNGGSRLSLLMMMKESEKLRDYFDISHDIGAF
jgi:hypothetical protein